MAPQTLASAEFSATGRSGSGPAPACASSGWPACHLCGGPFRSISRGAIYRVKSPVQRVHKAEIQPGVGGDAGNSRLAHKARPARVRSRLRGIAELGALARVRSHNRATGVPIVLGSMLPPVAATSKELTK
jgi:hypothetical protein